VDKFGHTLVLKPQNDKNSQELIRRIFVETNHKEFKN